MVPSSTFSAPSVAQRRPIHIFVPTPGCAVSSKIFTPQIRDTASSLPPLSRAPATKSDTKRKWQKVSLFDSISPDWGVWRMGTRSFAALRMTLVKSSRPQDEYYDGDEILRCILRCAQDDTVMPPKDNLTKEQR